MMIFDVRVVGTRVVHYNCGKFTGSIYTFSEELLEFIHYIYSLHTSQSLYGGFIFIPDPWGYALI